MSAYYNEIEPFAAQWLRNLIAGGHIAPGDVDERDIRDVHPDDLKGYAQAHFFAGLGGWSYALRFAGWPDDEPVWTGSCPCQPFSAAGAGGGFADERHLWPHFFHLIEQCRPRRCFGEQVASRDGLAWLDLVQTDLEGAGYTTAALDLCAAGVGAPHIRQRLYWVADAEHRVIPERPRSEGRVSGERAPVGGRPIGGSDVNRLADAERERWEWRGAGETGGRPAFVSTVGSRHAGGLADDIGPGLAQRLGVAGVPGGPGGSDAREAAERGGVCAVGGMAKPRGVGWEWRQRASCGSVDDGAATGRLQGDDGPSRRGETGARGLAVTDGGDAGPERQQRGGEQRQQPSDGGAGGNRPGPTNGFWRDPDWLLCRDGKWRPVSAGSFPLAHGVPARVGKLRAAGNAIVPALAAEFIRAYVG